MKSKKLWYIAVPILFGLWVLGQFVPKTEKPQPVVKEWKDLSIQEKKDAIQKKVKDQWFFLREMVRDEVKKKLKAPATADFPGDETYRVIDENKFEVVMLGSVDAQNSFGAMLRSHYIMNFTFLNDQFVPLETVVQ
jgi:hypothetical protein